MEHAKAVKDRDIKAICEYISNYCETHICTSFSTQHVRSFYTFFPTFLDLLFGSPTKRGFIQTQLEPHQDEALKNLLSIQGPFFQSLLRISQSSDYYYDLSNESLPPEVRKILSTGAIHLLPQVYKHCNVIMPSSPSGSTIDFHTSATKQSSLLPSGISSERKIQLNILQLYLYNFAILPTWSTATAQPPMSTFTSTSLRSPMNNTVPNTSTTSFLDNSSPSQLTKPGRSITSSIYTDILDNYLSRLIPINDQAFPAIVGPFFIDTLAELWIRMPWISNNNKLSPTLMYYISHFINYIVRHDLRRCVNNTQDNVYTYTYKATRDELYMLTSRLALNWDKTDDYIQIIELWCQWAAPWKLGTPFRSIEKESFLPTQTGWAPFILDNVPYYFSAVDILLKRISTFSYTDSLTMTVAGQLRILYRFINVFYTARDLIGFLALVEKALDHAGHAFIEWDQEIGKIAYGHVSAAVKVKEKMKAASERLAQIGGKSSQWRSEHLYDTEEHQERRSPSLIAAVSNLYHNINVHVTASKWPTRLSNKHLEPMQEAYHILSTLFNINSALFAPLKTASAIPGKRTGFTQLSFAGKQNGGYLTAEEKELLKQGKLVCSPHNIPAVGPRKHTIVRSHENVTLVRWTLYWDKQLNEMVYAAQLY
ncbi:hypothetical protein CU097_000718 [Rhizopus azygosporus]|uniref:Sphingomyelin phosphodiesterase 4 n=1 Tax=Rhizopus azygosporus TaxID=86630 RepID=A0A367IUD0_RHIAZ|nr:hypothetical protein CU097_000718 [Rhizopus azygosporus]CEJ02752.1 hypothetical protein RMCBS344292_16747 [Rhizopus microsporus]